MHIENENSGIVFFNEEKKNEKAPDWSGQLNIGGVQYRIALWENDGNKGPYFSASLTELDEEAEERPARRSNGGGNYRGNGGGGYRGRSNAGNGGGRDYETSGSGHGGGGRRTFTKPSRGR